MKTLTKSYEKAVKNYTDLFITKHDLPEIEFWVGGEIGGIVLIGDYYFNFSDIKIDIDQNIEEKTLFEWYDFAVEKESTVSYRSWIKGYRPVKCWISSCFFDEYTQMEGYIKELGFEPVSLKDSNLTKGVDSKYEIIVGLEALSKCQKLLLPKNWSEIYTCRIERDFFLEDLVSNMSHDENENIIYV